MIICRVGRVVFKVFFNVGIVMVERVFFFIYSFVDVYIFF